MHKDGDSRRRFYQIFFLTYASYGTAYITRKAVASAKPFMDGDSSFDPPLTPRFLGSIDSAFLLSYAICQVFLPAMADALGSRRFLCMALGTAGICSVLFSVANTRQGLLAAWVVEGIAHSPIFAIVLQILSGVIPASSRGFYFGLWNTSQQVGAMLSSSVATFLCHRYGWKTAFNVVGWITIGMAVILHVFLPRSEKTARSLVPVEEVEKASPDQREHLFARFKSSARMFVEALQVPNLLLCSVVYCAIKMTRYAMHFWIPFILTREFRMRPETAGYASAMFDFGGMFGAMALGKLSDGPMGGRRLSTAGIASAVTAVVILYLGLLCPSSPFHIWGNSDARLALCVIMVAGFVVSGADSILGSASAQEVISRYQHMTSKLRVPSVSTAAGIINGTGSFGGMLQGVMCPILVERIGWAGFFLFIGLTSLTLTLAIIPSVRYEFCHTNVVYSSLSPDDSEGF